MVDRRFIQIVIAAGIHSCTFFLLFLFASYAGQYKGCEFEPEEWKILENAGRGLSGRMCMVQELKKNYLQVGVSQDSILEWLGDPMKPREPTVYKYPIGSRPNMIDGEFLFIHFDGYGKLTDVYI